MLVDELVKLPEDKKPYAAGILMKFSMNRELAKRTDDYKEMIGKVNK